MGVRDEQPHPDKVHWRLCVGMDGKPAVIYARVVTSVTSRMYRSLWKHGSLLAAPTTGVSE